jgi:putative ABC transport system substrate-binding protein
MRRREFIGSLIGAAIAWPLVARAQQTDKMYSIGYLSAGASGPGRPFRDAFVEALRQLGWIEGKNVVFEYRYAENRLDRLPELAAELVGIKVDVIVAPGTPAPLAAKRATTTIPIVMSAAGDPLGTGLVASLARPGGNVTGMSTMVPDIGGKRLELLKELVPGISRVAVLWNAANPYPGNVFKETELAARTMGIEIQSLELRRPEDFYSVFEAAITHRPDGLITVDDPLTVSYRNKIVDFAATNRLPAIHGFREFVEAGGLMSYGASLVHLIRESAVYVDKILKGTKPVDLPVEQPTKFELVINLKAATALGLTIPPTIMVRADEVIE